MGLPGIEGIEAFDGPADSSVVCGEDGFGRPLLGDLVDAGYIVTEGPFAPGLGSEADG